MKKIYSFILSFVVAIGFVVAQTPNNFKYQAVVRDNNGQVIANKLVAIKLSLLANSTNGAEVYSEVHHIATNDFGVANLLVGAGNTVSGNFNTIDWGASTYFLKTELDINNGINFTFLGTSQLLSVPFALYAAKSANAANDFDKDSLNEIQNISLTGNNLQLNKNGGSIDLTKFEKDSQQLVLNGNTLSITRGNSIVLSSVVDLDADPTNEIQNLSLVNDTLKISKSNFVKLPKDFDSDSTNEIQTLSVNQNKLNLSKSNQVNIDADTLNEIQTLNLIQNKLILSKGNQVNIDADTTNEIQVLTQNENLVSLSKNGGNISLPSTKNAQNSSLLFASASGNGNYVLNLTPALTQYTKGLIVNFTIPNTNTGHVTINIDNLGSKSLFKNIIDTILKNELTKDKILSIIYDGNSFQLLNQLYDNSPIKEFAYFVDDEWDGRYGPVQNKWYNAHYNKTKLLFGNSISRIGDSIKLSQGIYKINAFVTGTGGQNAGCIQTRFCNINDTLNSIIGELDSKIGYQVLVSSKLDGYIIVNNDFFFQLQFYGCNISYGIFPTYYTPDKRINTSILIEKIK